MNHVSLTHQGFFVVFPHGYKVLQTGIELVQDALQAHHFVLEADTLKTRNKIEGNTIVGTPQSWSWRTRQAETSHLIDILCHLIDLFGARHGGSVALCFY